MALFLGVLALAFVHVFAKTKCYGSGGWGDLTIIWEHGVGPEKKHTVLIPELSGDALTPTETHNPPTVEWKTKAGHYYHFLMVDPDAPTPQNPTSADILHCLMTNIKGPDMNIYNGTHTEEYKGPAPPAGSDPHHYCQFLFSTEKEISWPARDDPSNRTHFDTQKFMDTIEATKGGKLQASTYFMAQHEDTSE